MKKVTKAQLIEHGKKLGLELKMKQTWAEMVKAIHAKELELAEKEREPKIEINGLVVLKNRVSDCGCSYIPIGTIAKLIRIESGERYTHNIRFYNSGYTVWVKESDIRPLTKKEAEYAEKRFSNATNSRYATVD